MAGARFLEAAPYSPPAWARALRGVPARRLSLARLPTPVAPWPVAGTGGRLFVKRDDLSGLQLSGNKVRKLEFLLADALDRGCDSVVTVGGVQSNHCRATATAARYLGLEPHLVLRTTTRGAEDDPGLTGNLLVDRLVGAHVHQVTKSEYQSIGSEALTASVAERLRTQGRHPYVIPYVIPCPLLSLPPPFPAPFADEVSRWSGGTPAEHRARSTPGKSRGRGVRAVRLTSCGLGLTGWAAPTLAGRGAT